LILQYFWLAGTLCFGHALCLTGLKPQNPAALPINNTAGIMATQKDSKRMSDNMPLALGTP
jgi:hypothetical protein